MAFDSTAPTIRSYTLDSYVIDLSQSSATIKQTAEISDDISGVTNGSNGDFVATAQWKSPSGNSTFFGGWFYNLVSGNYLSGIFSTEAVLNQLSETGIWTLNNLFVADEAGNTRWYSTNELDQIGIRTTLEVINYAKIISKTDPLTGERTIALSTTTSKATAQDGIIDRFTLQTSAAPSNPWRITDFNPQEDILQIPEELAALAAQQTLFGIQKVTTPDRVLTKSEQKSFKKQQKAASKSVKRIGRTGDGFAYNQLTGELFLDTNGSKKGFGEVGGLIAVLEDTPAISISNLEFL